MQRATIRIVIVDDHEIVREGLRTLLSDEENIEIVGEAASGRDALAIVETSKPDVVLMDLVMPGMDGIEATRRVREISPESHVLVLTSFAGDQHVREALQAGATGYMLKDVLKPELLRAIQYAAGGQPALHPEAQRVLLRQAMAPPSPFQSLTERELDVLRLIAQGCTNREIASRLHLTEGTVKGYVSAILAKLDVADRTQAALLAVKEGLDGTG